MKTPKEYNLMSKAHKLAKEIQSDEFNLHYHIALSRALKIVWNTLNRMNKVETAFTKEEKSLILSSLSNYNSITLYYNQNKELIAKLKQYSYKEVPFNIVYKTEPGTNLYLSTEIINNLK